jgi:hypothetical protein
MTCSIEVEPFDMKLYEEIFPLARKCWEESTVQKADTCAFYGERDFVIEPDVQQYQRLAEVKRLIVVTLRDETKLQGYIVGATYPSPHHKTLKVAAGDSIYVEPEYRSYTGVLVSKFEKAVRDDGANVIGWPTHFNGPVYGVLKAMGYVGDDIVMEKRLCA